MNGGDVDLFVGQYRDHVLEQSLTVPGAQEDIHRVGDAVGFPPGDFDHPVGVIALHGQQFFAVGPVHRDTAAVGNEPHHRVAGNRLAATGHVGQQVAHALNGHIAGFRGLGLGEHQVQLPLAVVRLQGLDLVDHMARAQVASPQGRQHIVAGFQVQVRRQGIQVHFFQGQAGHLLFEHGLALGDVHIAILAFEPLVDARPRRGGGHITQ